MATNIRIADRQLKATIGVAYEQKLLDQVRKIVAEELTHMFRIPDLVEQGILGEMLKKASERVTLNVSRLMMLAPNEEIGKVVEYNLTYASAYDFVEEHKEGPVVG